MASNLAPRGYVGPSLDLSVYNPFLATRSDRTLLGAPSLCLRSYRPNEVTQIMATLTSFTSKNQVSHGRHLSRVLKEEQDYGQSRGFGLLSIKAFHKHFWNGQARDCPVILLGDLNARHFGEIRGLGLPSGLWHVCFKSIYIFCSIPSFLLLVVWPGAPSSVLAPFVAMPFVPSSFLFLLPMFWSLDFNPFTTRWISFLNIQSIL